jgi:hypothetical protein
VLTININEVIFLLLKQEFNPQLELVVAVDLTLDSRVYHLELINGPLAFQQSKEGFIWEFRHWMRLVGRDVVLQEDHLFITKQQLDEPHPLSFRSNAPDLGWNVLETFSHVTRTVQSNHLKHIDPHLRRIASNPHLKQFIAEFESAQAVFSGLSRHSHASSEGSPLLQRIDYRQVSREFKSHFTGTPLTLEQWTAWHDMDGRIGVSPLLVKSTIFCGVSRLSRVLSLESGIKCGCTCWVSVTGHGLQSSESRSSW